MEANSSTIGGAAGASRELDDRLQRRLSEAWQGLWDSFVDPRESYGDDGSEWQSLGSGSGPLLAKVPFTTELELQHIRDQCRALAACNEFAINGHENRISYLVGAGHTYRAAARKGSDAPVGVVEQSQEVLDEFVADNGWHLRQQEIVRRGVR
jgi:hypothetical protein